MPEISSTELAELTLGELDSADGQLYRAAKQFVLIVERDMLTAVHESGEVHRTIGMARSTLLEASSRAADAYALCANAGHLRPR
jgi:hypothetical protein